MTHDTDKDGDPRFHLPADEPIITPERRAKGDLLIDIPCPECDGKAGEARRLCKSCRARGRVQAPDQSAIATADIRFVQLHANTVMNHLNREGVLTGQHVHDGQTFEAWRIVFRATNGLAWQTARIYNPERSPEEIRGLRQMLAEEGIGCRGGDEMNADYESLLQKLLPWQRQVIIFAVEASASEHARWLVSHHHAAYRTAFDRLSSLMDGLREAALNRQCENA